MENSTILVTGATGFLGQAVVTALLDAGYHVRALTRTKWPFAEHPNLTRMTGDVRDFPSMESAVAGVSYIVHLAASKNDEPESESVNIGGATVLRDVAQIAGVKRIINISTQSAKLKRKGTYGRTKEKADQILHEGSVPVVTLRCSLIYADQHGGIIGTINKYSKLPMVPLFGRGTARYRPMHRNDLATLIVAAMEKPGIDKQTYDIGGPDAFSLNEITLNILQRKNLRRPIMHIPAWMGLLAVSFLAPLGKSPVTRSNILGGIEDVPMDMTMLKRDFGDVPVRSFDQGLTEIFGAVPLLDDIEARVLLAYVLARVGRWEPDSAAIDRYKAASTIHGIGNTLDKRILRSRMRLSAIDAATRLRHPHALIRKKLLVATAIAETHPASAELLLPRERSATMAVLYMLDACAIALWKYITGVPYLLSTRLITRYAGTI